MKYIETGKYRSDSKNHYKIKVSDCDYEFLSQYNWHASIQTGAVSARDGLLALKQEEHTNT